MVVVADASVAIRGDMSGFHADLRGAEKATGGLATRIKDIFSPRNVIAGAGIFGVGLGIRQLVSFAGDASAAFSELQQTQRTTDEVFGDSASVIEDWAARAAEAAGMSQQTVFQSAAVMGQTLVNMGFDIDEAAEKTVMLQQRAAEMAIAFGTTPDRAILAITAAMRGERDTIEKFGVSIKQVDVNARVAALGLDTSTAATKKNSEAMAILDLVMEQTTAQSGRFADAQDDIAVRMATMQARIDNAIVTLGEGVAGWQIGVLDDMGELGDGFKSAGDAFNEFAMFFGEQKDKVAATAGEMGISIVELKKLIVAEMSESGVSFEVALEVVTTPQEVTAAVDLLTSEARTALMDQADAMRDAAGVGITQPILDRVTSQENLAAIRTAAYDSQVAYAVGLLDAQNEPQIAFDAAMALVEESMTTAQETAELEGNLLTLSHALGIASAEGNEAEVIAINGAIAVITSRLQQLGVDAYQWGFNVPSELARGLKDGKGLLVDPAHQLSNVIRTKVGIDSEPSDRSSGLYGITKWGGNIVRTLAGGMLDELGTASDASRALAGALSPSLGGSAMGSTAGMAGGTPSGGAGNTYQVYVKTLPDHPTLRDIGGELRRLGEMGKLPGSRS